MGKNNKNAFTSNGSNSSFQFSGARKATHFVANTGEVIDMSTGNVIETLAVDTSTVSNTHKSGTAVYVRPQ